jgi:hypothetical protein
MRTRVTVPIPTLTLSPLLLTSLAQGKPDNAFQVSTIFVTQGDSMWLHASGSTDILTDASPRSPGPTRGLFSWLQCGRSPSAWG